MHKLEGRGIWKVLLRKPWWHNAGEKKGKETCFYALGGFFFFFFFFFNLKGGFRKRLVLTLSALLWILKGVLLAPGAEPGAGAGNKRERQKKIIIIKSFNGNINCCSCGFYKTHKLFFSFFFKMWIGACPFRMEYTSSMGFTAQYGTQD